MDIDEIKAQHHHFFSQVLNRRRRSGQISVLDKFFTDEDVAFYLQMERWDVRMALVSGRA